MRAGRMQDLSMRTKYAEDPHTIAGGACVRVEYAVDSHTIAGPARTLHLLLYAEDSHASLYAEDPHVCSMRRTRTYAAHASSYLIRCM